MKKNKIKKGDTVKVISGKDKGKIGNVLKVVNNGTKLLVSGVNLYKKHTKPNASSSGGIKSIELPVHVSNVSYYDKNTSSCSKIGFLFLEDGKKVRVTKTNNEVIS